MENTRSRVLELDQRAFQILRDRVIFFDKQCWLRLSAYQRQKQKWLYLKKMIDKAGFFPTGILHRVIGELTAMSIGYRILDNRVHPGKGRLKLATRISEPPAYDDQNDCVRAFLDHEGGIASVPTGVGKTRILKDTIQALGHRAVVITPSTPLKEQTAEYLEDCFGAQNVGIYDKRTDLKPITVMNYHSFGKTDPREWQDVNACFFDEFHHAANDTIRNFNDSHLNSVYHRFALTATNFTNDDSEAILLESVMSKTVYEMSIRDAIEKGYICPVQAVFFDLPNDQLYTKEDYQKDFPVFVTDNTVRNQIIADTIEKMIRMGVPTLTLVKHIRHGEILTSMAADGPFLNATEKNSKQNMALVDQFNELKHPHIVATSVIGEGVNTKACGAVINAKAGRSKKEILQNIGRAVRRFKGKQVGFYFDFIDRGQKNLKSQSNARMKIFEEEFGLPPKVVKLS